MKAVDLGAGDLDSVREIASRWLRASLPASAQASVRDWPSLLGQLNRGSRFDLAPQAEGPVALDHWANGWLARCGLAELVRGIEFPANLRVSHGAPPPGYAARPYATDRAHSDIWAGEPADIVNVFLYLGGDLAASHLELYDSDQASLESLAAFTGPYESALPLLSGLERVDVEPRPGRLLLFDGACPHRTIREGGGVRVSLDFRLRRVDPYAQIDERWSDDYIPWSKYWQLPADPTTSLEERVAGELGRLGRHGLARALAARRRSLARAGWAGGS
ncbi:MAG: hypothetical protein MJE66_10260 [Proteobacteria bacterium]|nr:hypothetical protein [Pseudomonadota bacterium]